MVEIGDASLPATRQDHPGECIERLLQMLSRHGVGSPIVGEQSQRLAGQLQPVVDAIEPSGRHAGAAIICRQACPSAIRCPARLPLSTDETYFGSSGRRSCVSYQL